MLREINELHVPVGVPIKLTMTSEDVIHDFYVPAFRVKKDVLPGRYTSLWFQATKTGTYHILLRPVLRHGPRGNDRLGVRDGAVGLRRVAFGRRISMNPWRRRANGSSPNSAACTCHVADNTGRGPSLVGLYGKPEKLRSGETRIVDEGLIRQAIVFPNSVILPNYPPIMPTFQGQINEEQVLQLIAYVKSLGTQERTGK